MQSEDTMLLKDAREGHSLCWSCRHEVGTEPLCPACVKIQPLGRSSDYFTVMGLPRKLGIDTRVLEPVFHALSRRFHPDMYRMASGRERIIALENSAVLNQAYRTLRDPFDRAEYLLQLELGRQGAQGGANPPQELFEEILEIQELLGEFRFAEDEAERAALRPALEQKRETLRTEQSALAGRLTGELFHAWDALPDHAAPEQKRPLLDDMRRILDARAYLRRVLTSLDEALTHPNAEPRMPTAEQL